MAPFLEARKTYVLYFVTEAGGQGGRWHCMKGLFKLKSEVFFFFLKKKIFFICKQSWHEWRMPASTGLCRSRRPSLSREPDPVIVPRLIREDGATAVVTQWAQDGFLPSRKTCSL